MKIKSLLWVVLCSLISGSIYAQTNTFPATGNVGIGTINPIDPLHIKSTVPTAIRLENTSGGTYTLATNPDGKFVLHDQIAHLSRFVISTSGNIGIGTTTPQSLLSLGTNHGTLLSIGQTSWANTAVLSTGWVSGFADYTDILVAGQASNTARIRLIQNGNVGIGTTTPREKLSVNGKIRAQEIKVEVANWPDYVFEDKYQPSSLTDLETFIKANKHLPEMPSSKEAEEKGISLGEMNAKLLKKIEELTLYIINQNKQQAALAKEVQNLKNSVKQLQSSKE